MEEAGPLAPELVAKLAYRFEKRKRFDVTHRAADLADDEILVFVVGKHEVLDGIGHVRNDLDRRAEIIAAALARQDVGIDAPGRDIVSPSRMNTGEALVMAEVEIGLGAVVGHEDLAMLGRRHRSRVDVQIGIKLAEAHLVAARLQKCCEGGRSKTFSERGNHTTSDKEISRHGPSYYRNMQRYVRSKFTACGGFIFTPTLDKPASI